MQSRGACVAVLAAVFSVPHAAGQDRLSVPSEHLRGPVHTIQTELAEIYVVDGKELEKRRRPHQKVVYDRTGNEIERINFNPDGSVENRTVQIIDARGRIAGWEEYQPQPDSKDQRLTSRSEWVYDEKGRRVEARVYNDGILSHQTTATYDAVGHLVKETMVTDRGSWVETKEHTYDSDGLLMRTVVNTSGRIEVIEQTHDKSGTLTSDKYSGPDGRNDNNTKYTFDAQAREIERKAEDSLTKFKLVTSYDERGRVSKRITYFEYKQPNFIISHAPEPGTVEFRYNKSDQVVEESRYSPDGALMSKTINEYDSAGRLSSQTYGARRVSYEYDKWGNLVKKLSTGTNAFRKPVVFVEYHLITYYDTK